jgi:hypothetical protein
MKREGPQYFVSRGPLFHGGNEFSNLKSWLHIKVVNFLFYFYVCAVILYT